MKKETERRLVSIIIPVYNSEKHLKRCLESVISQTYSDIEIIIINDGSKDASLEIIHYYLEKDDRIIVINIENRGVSYARQLGLRKVRGDYIIFLDSDDYAEKKLVENMVNAVKESQCRAACSFFIIENVKEEKVVVFDSEDNIISAKELLYKYVIREFRGALWCWIFERDLFDNFSFPPNCALADDLYAIVHVLLSCDYVGLCKTANYHYVQNTSSLSRSGFTERYKNYYYLLHDLGMKIEDKYPEFKKDIIWSFSINEMSVISAMCKNNNFDMDICKEIMGNVRRNLKTIIFNKRMPLLYKASAIVIGVNYKVFIFIYELEYKLLKLDFNKFNLTVNNKNKR